MGRRRRGRGVSPRAALLLIDPGQQRHRGAGRLAGTAGTPGQRECFEYDPLNRLTKAYTSGKACSDPAPSLTHGSDPYDLAYAYDVLGNITQVTDGGVATVYDYTGTAHPHAPVTVGGDAYTYDGNGATVTRPVGTATQALKWTRLHQLKEVTGPGASTFVYDADRSRLLRTTGGTTTLYLYGMELEAVNGSAGTTVTAKRYYGGTAMRTPGGVRVRTDISARPCAWVRR